MKLIAFSLLCVYVLFASAHRFSNSGSSESRAPTCDLLHSQIQQSKNEYEKNEDLWFYLIAKNYTTTADQPAGNFFNEFRLTDKQDLIYRKSELVEILSKNVANILYRNKRPQYYDLNPTLAKTSSCVKNFFKSFCTDSKHYKCDRDVKYRTIDGFCNNWDRPKDGAAETQYASLAYQYYRDSIREYRRAHTSGDYLPNYRHLVNQFFNKCQNQDVFLEYAPSLVGIMFGQLITHDVSFKPFPQRKEGGPDLQCCKADLSGPLPKVLRHPICEPIAIPKYDAFFGPKNITCMEFLRTQNVYDNECVLSSRKQINFQTSFLDMSSVYGTSWQLLKSLRTLKNGALKLGANRVFPTDDKGGYIFADIRTPQTPVLSLLHSQGLREHNRLAALIHKLKPNWTDETVFQEARRWNIAKYQHIVFEWLKVFIASEYRTLRLKKNTCLPFITTTNEFAHSAFRHLHTLSPQKFEYYNESGTKVYEVPLSDTFVGPFDFLDARYDDLVRGLFYQKTNFNGCQQEVLNHLFKNAEGVGIDLISMDISRTDDHGIQPYYVYLWMCHRKKVKTFEDLRPIISVENINLLKKVYRSVYDVHLYVGSKLEKQPNTYQFGPTISCIVNEQFHRYRVADPYFYDAPNNIYPFTSVQLAEIKKASFARLLCDNAGIKRVATNPFYAVSFKNKLIDCKKVPVVNVVY